MTSSEGSREYTGVGVMSGTSMDGLDLCCVRLQQREPGSWSYEVVRADTVPYSEHWKQKLTAAPDMSGVELTKLNVEYGHYVGTTAKVFLKDLPVKVDFVACHGHTIHHKPAEGFTYQLLEGETMVSHLECPMVCNFRSKDVALGGQGAPLVPYGERFLFGRYDFCLNLGGIANISIKDSRRGYDICPCNMLLNHLAKKVDPTLEFDRGGDLARSGTTLQELLMQWNSLEFYDEEPPKSLGREWFETYFVPSLASFKGDHRDTLRTSIDHICQQITIVLAKECQSLEVKGQRSLLITGGGAFNTFLIELLTKNLKERELMIELVETSRETVEYKEALVFAFLGLRCLRGETNISRDVTGASCDSVGGSIHLPPSGCTNRSMF